MFDTIVQVFLISLSYDTLWNAYDRFPPLLMAQNTTIHDELMSKRDLRKHFVSVSIPACKCDPRFAREFRLGASAGAQNKKERDHGHRPQPEKVYWYRHSLLMTNFP